ncbi:MAG: hypothetical protein V1872_12195 [bacterium]
MYLRNYFIHRGDINGKSLFYSNESIYKDKLNSAILFDIEIEANKGYSIKNYKHYDLQLGSFSNKSLFELLQSYLLYSDHGIGILINVLVAKQTTAREHLKGKKEYPLLKDALI